MPTIISEYLDCPHTIRVLEKAGIHTMEELEPCTYEDLLQFRGIGKVIAGDLVKKIEAWKAENKSQES